MTENARFLTTKRALGALRLVFILAVLCLEALPLFAQFDTGTINGTVTDSSGAAVSNAKVTISNTGTGDVKNVTTNSTGFFIGSALPFGNYVVTATSNGFAESKKAHHFECRSGSAANLALLFPAPNRTWK